LYPWWRISLAFSRIGGRPLSSTFFTAKLNKNYYSYIPSVKIYSHLPISPSLSAADETEWSILSLKSNASYLRS
jgi:hypothetical protein